MALANISASLRPPVCPEMGLARTFGGGASSSKNPTTAQIMSSLQQGTSVTRPILDTMGIDPKSAPNLIKFMEDPTSVHQAAKLGVDSPLLRVITEFAHREAQYVKAGRQFGFTPQDCDRSLKSETVQRAEAEATQLINRFQVARLGCPPEMGIQPATHTPAEALKGGPKTHLCESTGEAPGPMIDFFSEDFTRLLDLLKIPYSSTQKSSHGPGQVMVRAQNLGPVIDHLSQTRPDSPEYRVLASFHETHAKCGPKTYTAFVVQRQEPGDPSGVPKPHIHGQGMDGPTYTQVFSAQSDQGTAIYQPGAKPLSHKPQMMQTLFEFSPAAAFVRLATNAKCLFYGENPHQGPPAPLKGPRVLIALATVPERYLKMNKI